MARFTVSQINSIITRANERRANYYSDIENNKEKEKARIEANRNIADDNKPANLPNTYDVNAARARNENKREQEQQEENAIKRARSVYDRENKLANDTLGDNEVYNSSKAISEKNIASVNAKQQLTVQGANKEKPKTVNVPFQADKPATVQNANIEKPVTVSTKEQIAERNSKKPVTVQGANEGKQEAAAITKNIRIAKDAYDAAAKKLSTGGGVMPDFGVPVVEEKAVQEALSAYDRINNEEKQTTAIEQNTPLVERYESVKNSRKYDNTVSSVIDLSKAAGNTKNEYLMLALNDEYRDVKRITSGGYEVNYAKFDYLRSSEKDVVKYYLATGNDVSAENYLKALEPSLNEREASKRDKKIYSEAYNNPVIGAAKNVAYSFIAPAAYIKTASQYIFDKVTGNKTAIDANAPEYRGAAVVSKTGEAIGKRTYDDVLKATGSDKIASVAQMGASVGLSIAQNIPNVLVAAISPTASLSLMASSVAGTATKSMLDDGVPTGQALLLGTVSGAIEYVTEKIPLDSLLDLINTKNMSSARKALLAISKQMVTESAEEGISEITNVIADSIVRQDNSEWQQYVDYLVSNGLSEPDAQKQAFKQLVLYNTLQAAAGGAVSGAFFSSSAILMNQIENSQFAYELGRDIKQSGNAQTAINEATKVFDRKSQVFQKAIKYQSDPDSIPNYMLGKIAMTLNTYSLGGGTIISNLPIAYDDVIYGDGASNKQIDAIINSAEAREALTAVLGREVLTDANNTMSQKRAILRDAISTIKANVDNSEILGGAVELYKKDKTSALNWLANNINKLNNQISLVRNSDIPQEDKVSAIKNGMGRVAHLKNILDSMRNGSYNIYDEIDIPKPFNSLN